MGTVDPRRVGLIEEALAALDEAAYVLRYDAVSGQYIFNLATKGLTSGTSRLKIDLGDGMVHTLVTP